MAKGSKPPVKKKWADDYYAAKSMGLEFIEERTHVYPIGPGEATPKRRYILMDPTVHNAKLMLWRYLGMSQQDASREELIYWIGRMNKQREDAGLPPVDIDFVSMIKVDKLKWASVAMKAKLVACHENDGVPFAFKSPYLVTGERPGPKKREKKDE